MQNSSGGGIPQFNQQHPNNDGQQPGFRIGKPGDGGEGQRWKPRENNNNDGGTFFRGNTSIPKETIYHPNGVIGLIVRPSEGQDGQRWRYWKDTGNDGPIFKPWLKIDPDKKVLKTITLTPADTLPSCLGRRLIRRSPSRWPCSNGSTASG